MTYTKQNFLNRLAEGNKTENYLAQALINAGIDIEQPVYPEGMPRAYYTKNQVDIVANGLVLEVKGRNQTFTSTKDFRYPTLFVESVDGFDKKINTPAYYVNVSNPTGGIIALDVGATKDRWVVEKITDRQRGYSYDMYISAREDWFDFEELVGRLKDAGK